MAVIALDTLEQYVAAETERSESPKYRCVFDAFEKGIRTGRFKPGQRVPAENELTRRLPVSLGTLQKALTQLAQRGLVVRTRKTGTFIAERRHQAAEVFVYRFQDPATGHLLLPFVRVLDVCIDEGQEPWHEALNVERCVRIDRLVWVDQDPPALSRVFFSHEHGKVLLDMPLEDLHGSSSHRVLIEHFDLPTLRMEHRIGCRALSDKACEHLLIPPGTVGTVWDVKDYSIHDKPSLFQRFEMPPGHRPMEISENLMH